MNQSTNIDRDLRDLYSVFGIIAVTMILQWVFWSSGKSKIKKLSAPDMHLSRRFQHATTGLLFFLELELKFLPSVKYDIVTLLVCAALFYTIHRVRLYYPRLNLRLVALYRPILREKEASGEKIPSAFFFLIGTAFTMILFPQPIAAIALLHLSLGDPIAGIIGSCFGSYPLPHVSPKKTVEGFVSCVIICTLVSLLYFICSPTSDQLFVSSKYNPKSNYLLFAVIAGLCGGFAEVLSIGELDDNLTLPVLSGTFFTIIHHIVLNYIQ